MSNQYEKYNLECLTVRFSSILVKNIPKSWIPIIFASPLSARSPDLYLLWHQGYYKKNRNKILITSFLLALISVLKYFKKLLLNGHNFAYALYGKPSKSILAIPSLCVKSTIDNKCLTDYIKTENDDFIFLWGKLNSCGAKERKIKQLPFLKKFYIVACLLWSGFKSWLACGIYRYESSILFFTWFTWITDLNWTDAFLLERVLSEQIEKYGIEKIGCVHEMHSHARIIWILAHKYGLKSYTIQHATVSEGKRWYFPYQEEINNGLRTPSVMYVFNDGVINLLYPHYKNTTFKLGCSSRYSKWKDFKDPVHISKLYVLFVGALAGFDNDLIFKALRKITSSDENKNPYPIKLRLHPFAIINKSDKKWLEKKQTEKTILLSKETNLFDDLKNAAVVIGMSTTVLEEALLLRKPVIQLNNDNFLKYIDLDNLPGVKTINLQDFCQQDLTSMAKNQVNPEIIRERLGLNQPEITYKMLFS